MKRRLVVTVCPREPGVVVLPVEPGGRAERLTATTIVDRLRTLVARRRLESRVRIQQACAGGCAGDGPNVGVAILAMPAPGEPPDNVAIAWRTYVVSLPTLDCLARVLDDNLGDDAPVGRHRPRTRRRNDHRVRPPDAS